MLSRVLPLSLVALALAVFAVARADNKAGDKDKAADQKAMEGKIVSVEGNKFTMSDKDGKNEHTHTLALDAKITCDGKECKLADLKAGTLVRVTTDKADKTMAVRVEATTKNSFDKDGKDKDFNK
jgi:hypothetical protein